MSSMVFFVKDNNSLNTFVVKYYIALFILFYIQELYTKRTTIMFLCVTFAFLLYTGLYIWIFGFLSTANIRT